MFIASETILLIALCFVNFISNYYAAIDTAINGLLKDILHGVTGWEDDTGLPAAHSA